MSTYKARSVAYHDYRRDPSPPPRPQTRTKRTRRWCKGRVGVEHAWGFWQPGYGPQHTWSAWSFDPERPRNYLAAYCACESCGKLRHYWNGRL